MRVLCAPNAFKGTLTAEAAGMALADGARLGGAEATVHPVADGGDGTLGVLLAASPGSVLETVEVDDPLGARVTARWGRLGDRTTAVVELAEAAGLRLLGDRAPQPRDASTYGAGELIRAAVAGGARRIIVGVGGSATTDGGAGLLRALGAVLRDAAGVEIGSTRAIGEIAMADLAAARDLLRDIEISVAVDVESPLLGEGGAARLFGPQKGATPGDVAQLESALARYAEVIEKAAGLRGLHARPGMGAAGGAAFGLAALGAAIVDGAALICAETGLDAAIAGAGLVLTGEGRLDRQTARGKAPAEVARLCRAHGIPCVAIAGEVADALPDLFTAARALGPGTAGNPEATRAALVAAAQATVEAWT